MNLDNRIFEFKGSEKEGKSILIISGVHGNELTPIYSTIKLIDYLNNASLKFLGDIVRKITVVNGLNVEGLRYNNREYVSNNTFDMNRSLDAFKDNYVDRLSKLIDDHDVVIDIHSSPKCGEFVLLNQNEETNSYVDFCKRHNINYGIRYSNTNTIKKYVQDLGKISFTLELNGLNYVDTDSADSGLMIILSIMKNIDELKINKENPKHPVLREIFTHHEGIFRSFIRPNRLIQEGDNYVGMVTTLDNCENMIKVDINEDQKLRVIAYSDNDYIHAGKSICLVQEIIE